MQAVVHEDHITASSFIVYFIGVFQVALRLEFLNRVI